MSEPIDKAELGDGGEPLSVGAQLRAARVILDAELTEVSQAIRIDIPLIAALEADEFDAVGAPVFAKGYLRTYAGYLQLDADALLEQYYDQVGREELPMVRGKAPIKFGDERSTALWIGLGVLLLIIALALWAWWQSGVETLPVPELGADAPAPVAMVTPPAAEATPDPAPSAVDIPAKPPATAAQQPAQQPVPEPVPEPVTGTLRVELEFQEDSWAEVSDGSGRRLFYGLGRSGARSRFSGQPPISFLLGNADGVRLRVNDQIYVAPPESRQGNLARFVLLDPDA